MAKQNSLLNAGGAGATGDAWEVPVTGFYIVRYFGTFDGTTVTLQTYGDNGTSQEWIGVPDSAQTAAWSAPVFLEKRSQVRVITTGGTSPSVHASINLAV